MKGIQKKGGNEKFVDQFKGAFDRGSLITVFVLNMYRRFIGAPSQVPEGSKNSSKDKQEIVKNIFGIQVTNSLEKYLGLPIIIGKGKKKAFRGIMNKMRQRVQSWSQKRISDGGKEVFIKQERKGIHWLPWRKMCIGKWAGGMGFRDMEHFNKALLVKYGWRLLHNTSALAYKVLKEKYFPKISFFEASVGRSLSYIWRSIGMGRKLLRHGVR
ncbi:uncharacterized protein LOC111303378 [Durio zibethinus]|uniref:Uncharacterized protein LOC111303378 n=1 Tax=Durio zibethinus TaxID=66656 RepID=A0A6P5ZRK4_DURZI|nr:uncharacterized protein LOC111303378 [Durio zibethinus]